MATLEQAAATEFLGREFATWIYWKGETHGNRVKIEGLDEFQVWFESPVELVADYGDATVVTVRGGAPLDSPEARRALREGKTISRTRLRIIHNNQTYTLGFDAGRFAVTGLRLPLPPSGAAEDLLLLRLEILQDFDAFLSKVFDAFLAIRLDDKAWQAERRKVAAWIGKFDDAK